MQISTAQLNQVAAILGTTDKQAVLTVVMGTLVKNGVPVDVAMDAVFGEGSYMKLASKVYHELRGETVTQ